MNGFIIAFFLVPFRWKSATGRELQDLYIFLNWIPQSWVVEGGRILSFDSVIQLPEADHVGEGEDVKPFVNGVNLGHAQKPWNDSWS